MRLGGHIVCVWDPMADEMNKRLPKVNEEILQKDPLAKGKLHETVTAAMCKTKHQSMARKYRDNKRAPKYNQT